MTLPAGTRLGPFEILAPLGAGGMGEVYRARDTRLGREVAVKVLSAEFASDADRRRRLRAVKRRVAKLCVNDGAPVRTPLRARALPCQGAGSKAFIRLRFYDRRRDA